MNRTAKIVRWLARILSLLILLFWGYFIIAHLFGGGDQPSRTRNTSDHIGLTAMGIALLGLVVAWKWELIGAVMALGGYVILGLDNWRALGGPLILWPIAAVLFLSSWWMHKATQRDTATMRPTG